MEHTNYNIPRFAGIRKWAISILLIGLVAMAGSGVARALIKYRPEAEKIAVENPGYTVEVEPVAKRDYRHYISGYGTAAPIRTATVSAEVGGIIDWTNASLRVGSPITKGDLVCKIDSASYWQESARRRSMLDESQAELRRIDQELENSEARIVLARKEHALAKQETARQKELGTAGAGTEQALDQAEKQLQVAERMLLEIENQFQMRKHDRGKTESLIVARNAELELARLDLERCEIRAPISGSVASRTIEPGEFVAAGTNLCRIVDISVVEIPIYVPASEAGTIALDTAVTVTLPQNPGQRWEGVIKRIAPEIDPLNRTVALYVEVDNRGAATALRLGQLVKAQIGGVRYTDKIVIPRRALIDEYAFIKKGNLAERRRPAILRSLGDVLILESGIAEDEELIVTNLEVLYDGARVITSRELNARTPSSLSVSTQTEGE